MNSVYPNEGYIFVKTMLLHVTLYTRTCIFVAHIFMHQFFLILSSQDYPVIENFFRLVREYSPY